MGNRMDTGDEMVKGCYSDSLLTNEAHLKTLRAEEQGCNETTSCIWWCSILCLDQLDMGRYICSTPVPNDILDNFRLTMVFVWEVLCRWDRQPMASYHTFFNVMFCKCINLEVLVAKGQWTFPLWFVTMSLLWEYPVPWHNFENNYFFEIWNVSVKVFLFY